MKRALRNCLAVIASCLPLVALAAWPDRPIRLIVPYSAGGTADSAARIVAKKLTEQTGQSVIIDNKPGASGVIGAQYVAQSKPDGYTVLFDASAFIVYGALHKRPFEPLKDFIPVSLVAKTPMVLIVRADSPFHTLADFIAAARKKPKALTFSSAGTGTATHLGFELFDQQARMELVHVPYKGGAPAVTDVMTGQIDSSFGLLVTALPFIKAGKLRALAITSLERVSDLPDVPTLAESGYPGFEVLEWNGTYLPRNTPADVVASLSRELRSAVSDTAVDQRLRQIGMYPVGDTPEEFMTFLQSESKRWYDLVKARGIKADD
jgi:tripartite-type tricarboxylate transporter receptor subunit TctC